MSCIKRAERDEVKAKRRESTKTWKVDGGRESKIMVGTRVALVPPPPPPFSSALYSHGSVMRIAAIEKEISNMDSRWFLDKNTIKSFGSRTPCIKSFG